MPIKKPKTSYAEARSMSMAQRDRGIGIATPPAAMDNAPTPSNAAVTDAAPKNPPPPNKLEAAPPRSDLVANAHRTDAMTPTSSAPLGQGRGLSVESQSKRVRMSAFLKYPQPGVSKTFDKLAGVYGKNTAMREILTRALDAFASAPVFPDRGIMPKYPMEDDILTTTRQLDSDLLNAARASFDPLGIAKAHAVGNYVFHVALFAYFEKDRSS